MPDKRRLDITSDGAVGRFHMWKAFGGSLEHGVRFRDCFPSSFSGGRGDGTHLRHAYKVINRDHQGRRLNKQAHDLSGEFLADVECCVCQRLEAPLPADRQQNSLDCHCCEPPPSSTPVSERWPS